MQRCHVRGCSAATFLEQEVLGNVLHMDIAQQCDAYVAAMKDPQARLYAEVITRGLHVGKAAAALMHTYFNNFEDGKLGTEESQLMVYTNLLTELGRHDDGLRTVAQGLDAMQGSALGSLDAKQVSGLGTEGGPPIANAKQEHWLPENWTTDLLTMADLARARFVYKLHKAAKVLVAHLHNCVPERAMLDDRRLLVNPVLQQALWTSVESSGLGKLGSAAARVSKFFKSAVMEGLVTERQKEVVVGLDRLRLAAKRAVGVCFATRGLTEGLYSCRSTSGRCWTSSRRPLCRSGRP